MLSAAAIEELAAALAAAAHGERGAAARRLAARFNCSVSTVYRLAGRGGRQRGRQPARPEYREAVRLAVDLAHRAPAPVPMDLALEALAQSGLCPAEHIPPLSTANRIAREQGWRMTRRRTQRMHADYPMQALQIDGSTSQFLSVGEQVGDDDYELHLVNRISARGYKNKPLAAHRLRLVVYGLWDMCTGYARCDLTAARGESALDQTDALCRMLAATGDPRRPLHGLPDSIWSDNGAWRKSPAVRDLMERLGIDLPPSPPYAKERMGGVERPWRTLWARFERSLYLLPGMADAARRPPLRLSWLQERLIEYEARENQRGARVLVAGRRASRAAAWVALSNGRPAANPLRRMPADAIATLCREERRRADRNGMISWDGVEYECPWHDCWVTVRRPAGGDGGLIVAEHAGSGERAELRPHQPRPHGQVRGQAKTPLARLLEEAPAAGLGADVYAPSPPAAGLAPMPARSAAAPALADPLAAADACRDAEEALALLAELLGAPIPPGPLRDDLGDELMAAGLSRRAVHDLAAEIAAADAERTGAA